jgi:hypothetical protein
MTISKNHFHRFSIATQIFGTLVASTVLLAGIDAANAKNGGGGGGGNHGSGSMGSHNSGGSMGNSRNSSGGNFWSGNKSNHAIIERPAPTGSKPPVMSKGNGHSKDWKESRRELRKEYKHELKKKIAELKWIERCKVFGKCGGIGKPVPIGPTPVKIGKPIPSPVGKPPVTTTGGGSGPVLSDPGYGKPGTGGTQTSGGGSTGGGGGGPASGPPSGGTTIKQF